MSDNNNNNKTQKSPTTNEDNDRNEFWKLLEASYSPMKVTIINDPHWHPMMFQTTASYITINGNEEVCGSSFSDSETSFMAGIGGGGGAWVCGGGGAWGCVGEEARGWMEVEESGNGEFWGNEDCCDDDMLAVFLGGEVV